MKVSICHQKDDILRGRFEKDTNNIKNEKSLDEYKIQRRITCFKKIVLFSIKMNLKEMDFDAVI